MQPLYAASLRGTPLQQSPKDAVDAMLLASSFSCSSVHMSAFVNGNKEGDGDSNKGSEQATATATKRVMVTAIRVAGNKKGNSNGGKSNGNSVEGGRQATAMRAIATRVAAEQR
jgi:hypothetical protein